MMTQTGKLRSQRFGLGFEELMQRLELEAELDRTETPRRSTQAGRAATNRDATDGDIEDRGNANGTVGRRRRQLDSHDIKRRVHRHGN